MSTNPERIVLACGGGGCCPEVEKKEDGSIVLHDTDAGRDQHIVLNADQTKMLRDILNRKR
jgi:hypothetical protein